MSVRVVATDLETGETKEVVIEAGNYVLFTVAPCYQHGTTVHANGTHVITVKEGPKPSWPI